MYFNRSFLDSIFNSLQYNIKYDDVSLKSSKLIKLFMII